jgi:molybdopterin/thiamine biosynthesis adenylyltransferase
LANFNRQAGASLSTLGQLKLDVLSQRARNINPDLDIVSFEAGVTRANVGAFLKGVDLFVDGLDFFAFEAREFVFAACRDLGIPAITAAPLGMGAALLNFLPDRMSFAEYFGFAECSESELPLRFLLGLAPAMLHRRYLVDASFVDLRAGRGPSTGIACHLCAGIAGTEALKILLSRGNVTAAPHGVQFDAYRNELVHTWRPWGWRNPVQRIATSVAKKHMTRIHASRAVT